MPYGICFARFCSISFIIYIDFILIFGEVTINIRDCQEFPMLFVIEGHKDAIIQSTKVISSYAFKDIKNFDNL